MDIKKERKFVKGLTGPGSAAKVRETVSVAVRESSLTKPKYVEPLDYETVVVKNKTVLHNDPQREMLLFPHDDVSQSTLPRRFRTSRSSVPPSAIKEARSLMVKECIKSYTSSWNVIHYKYSAYSGSYLHLPKVSPPDPRALPPQIFEVDAEAEGEIKDEDGSLKQRNQHITMKGWLFKGPDSGQESSIMSFTRSFKRRYFYLKQQADTTYILEFHKDDKKIEPKGSIFLDSASAIIKNPKRGTMGKNTFQIQMQEKNSYLLATETESDMDEWVTTLKKVIQSNDVAKKPPDRLRDKEGLGVRENFQESLEHSMNPQLQKYARETDSVLAQQRKEERQQLFSLYPELKSSKPPDLSEDGGDVEVYKEVFGKRLVVKCEGFTTRLQANLNEDGSEELLSNPEPFYISLCLYDARAKEKISEDFHFDPNSETMRGMVPKDIFYALDMLNGNTNTIGNKKLEPDLHGLDPKWVSYPKLAVFSVADHHPDIYLVARIEKILQGSVTSATEPYVRNPDMKVGTKIHKAMKTYCHKLGHYRMPFAWAVKNVFKPFSGELDMHSDFVLYRADSVRHTEEELIKQLNDFKKPEKQNRLQNVHGKLTINLFQYKPVTNTLTSSLVPVSPFPEPPTHEPTVEVEEFQRQSGRLASPHTTYTNNLYVCPRSLKYDGQKAFPKARNVAVSVEIRDSDEEGAIPLKLIRGRPGGPLFTSSCNATVLHHNTTPTFMEEVKILLPTQLHEKHHIMFKFHHVSCDLSKTMSAKASAKKVHGTEVPVGYAWFPLLINGRVNVGEQQTKVAMTLAPGYLGHENLGLGKGNTGPEIRWVDSTKPLFHFTIRLASTIYSRDQHLHNFFAHCQRLKETPSAGLDVDTNNKLKNNNNADGSIGSNYVHRLASFFDHDTVHSITQQDAKPGQGQGRRPAPDPTCGIIQGLLAVDVSTVIQFLPTLFNQLFRLLPRTNSEDVAMNTVRVLTHMVAEIHKAKHSETQEKPDILQTYVKYVFMTETAASTRDKTVHEELASHLNSLMRPAKTDSLDIETILNHIWFFFDIIVKSMAQHLLSTGRIKMARNERFPYNFTFTIQNLITNITTQILQKYREKLGQTRNANISLANFIKRCFTYMDRGFVFKLINLYIEKFSPGDPKILHEFKFDFLSIICQHEHYIPLNLPLMRKQVKNYKDLKHDYTLSEEFRKNHFLVGLMLHELKLALNEIRDIRKNAIITVRNLLAKHAFDDRYSNKSQQARIANLYLPFITIILENKNRLVPKENVQSSPTQANGDVGQLPEGSTRSQLVSYNSSVSLDTNASSVTLSNHGNSMPRNIRDPAVFALISGQGAASTGNLSMGLSEARANFNGSSTSLASSTSSNQSTATEKGSEGREGSILRSHSRQGSLAGGYSTTASTAGSQFVVRYDKLDHKEVRDLLLCFLFVVDNLSEDVLLGWFNNSSEYDILDFFTILENCMQQFKYLGRRRITSLCIIGDTRHAVTLPATSSKKPNLLNYNRASSAYGEVRPVTAHGTSQSEADAMFQAMMEANLSSEVAITVLDIISLYTIHFKDQLHFRDGDNPVMAKLFDLYLSFLQTSQSEIVQKHAFGALRSFINKFAKVLFVGDASMCGRLCYEILRCCNSRLKSTRSEACALVYLLMRSNFEFCQRKSFTRVHLQIIVAVSELINDVVGLSNSRAFTDSLSIINSFAHNDKAMQRLAFPSEVNDLTKRVRTVLMATAQMKEHQNDPEMLVDLQYCLAKSYTSTPELRKTWLQNMAKKHKDNKDYSEAAHCYIHIAALVAEYLKRRGEFPQGCVAFRRISANVETEEAGMKDDAGMQDFDYSEDKLTSLLEECAALFEQAERYEVLGDIYRLIIPIYERKRDFQKLADAYSVLHRSYNKIVEVMLSGKRLLGSYYRVAYFGQSYFEEEDGKEYVYKEPKITSLTEICDRLKSQFSQKFGKENVNLIRDSNKVNPQDLDSKMAYIQVTHVTPYFDVKEADDRVTDFERNNNIRRFRFETPFTKSGKAHGEVEEQWKRRTILTTSNSFPYVKKRIQVVYHREENLSPIEVAIDEMTNKVSELDEVVNAAHPSLKWLQLKLQGSVGAQVNQGPLAYAEVFLEGSNVHKYDIVKVNTLKDLFREFLDVCDRALKLNQQMIMTDQIEYHESLMQYHRDMTDRLSEIFGEQLSMDDDRVSVASHRSSMTVFSVISASGQSSQV